MTLTCHATNAKFGEGTQSLRLKGEPSKEHCCISQAVLKILGKLLFNGARIQAWSCPFEYSPLSRRQPGALAFDGPGRMYNNAKQYFGDVRYEMVGARYKTNQGLSQSTRSTVIRKAELITSTVEGWRMLHRDIP